MSPALAMVWAIAVPLIATALIVVTLTAVAPTVEMDIDATTTDRGMRVRTRCRAGSSVTGLFDTGLSTANCERTVGCHGISCSISIVGNIPTAGIADTNSGN